MANDYFQFRQFTIHQQRCAMKVGTDGTLLGAWASLPEEFPTNGVPQILDVGTGTGLIALMMAQRYSDAYITAIDIDADAVAQASENVASTPFASRIRVTHCDVADAEGCYDAIVCNPPFFTHALHSPDDKRTLARHADALPYRLLAQRAWMLLQEWGELSVVVPTQQKNLMESETVLAGFFKSRECVVKTTVRKPAKRVMMAFRKHPTPLQNDEITIGTEKYTALTKEFYL